MANSFYNAYADVLLGLATFSAVDWDADTIKVYLLDAADHTTNLETDVFEDDITAAAEVAVATIANPSITNGVLDHDDVTFSSVTGDESEELTWWKDTGTPSTSPLLLNVDTASSGLPITPNGGDITVQINASGLLKLVA